MCVCVCVCVCVACVYMCVSISVCDKSGVFFHDGTAVTVTVGG